MHPSGELRSQDPYQIQGSLATTVSRKVIDLPSSQTKTIIFQMSSEFMSANLEN